MADATTPTPTPTSAPGLLDRAWKARHEGRPLPAELRERLERALGADLSAVRVHTGPAADAAARGYGADAIASGSAVFFRDGAYHPQDLEGMHLLAHEVAHTVQQADGLVRVHAGWESDAEAMADRFADAFTAAARGGYQYTSDLGVRVVPGPSGLVQRHSSFEHRYLGDGTPDAVRTISTKVPPATREALIKKQLELFTLFRRADPRTVTQNDIRNVDPSLLTFELGPDRIVCTYGELNALPDYLSSAQQTLEVGADILLPILQIIRQEGFNEFTALLDGKNPYVRFPLSPFQPTGAWWGIEQLIEETLALDELTAGLGIAGQDHYSGLLARNACHFAPYSWYRWYVTNEAARAKAKEAHRASGDHKIRLENETWKLHGYADHFLQDSFAAGHLIDKTLVMQWFIEWAKDTEWVADESVIHYMTAALQPGLAAGSQLYNPTYKGPSHDPQTVQELHTLAERASATRLRAGRSDGPLGGYLDYLTFLTGAAGQLGAVLLHNHYNDDSVWAASDAQPVPYRLFGDSTLMSGDGGGEGAYNTAAAAQLSRDAIKEIFKNGDTTITTDRIRSRFPTRVGSTPNSITSIEAWATGQRAYVEANVFEGARDIIGKALARLFSPRLGLVSRDEPLGQQWSANVNHENFVTNADTAVLPLNGRLFASGRGRVFELNPVSGAPLANRAYTIPGDFGTAPTTLASDGRTLFVGISGRVHGLPLDGAWNPTTVWSSQPLGGRDGGKPVSQLVWQGKLVVASHGYVYELRPETGSILQEVELGSKVIDAAYPVSLATDGNLLYAGTHAYVYALPMREPWGRSWLWYSAHLGGGALIHQPVGVLVENNRLFAVSNGNVYELPRDNSERILQHVDLGTGRLSEFVPNLASDGGKLYVGFHGLAFALQLNTKWASAPQWKSEVLSNLGAHSPVDLLYTRDRLFAGCDGYAYELDVLDGATRQQWELTYLFTTALDMPTDMGVTDKGEVYIGVHGYAYGMLLAAVQPSAVAAWPLAQQPGATLVTDLRGIHQATASNVEFRPLSALGSYAHFNGTSSSISTAGRVLDTTRGRPFTVQAWVRLDALPAAANFAVLSQSGTQAAAFTLGYSLGAKSWFFERTAQDEKSPILSRVYAGTAAVPGVWTHLSAVYDPNAEAAGKSTARMRIYVNGLLKGTQDLDPAIAFDSRGPLQIGAARHDGRTDEWLYGGVRDVRVYDQALDDMKLAPRAAAFWRLDETSGDIATDRRHQHDAVATGVTWTRVDGVGWCAALNGRTSAITTKYSVLNTGAGGSFTVAAWVRLDALPTGAVMLVGQDAQRVSAFSLQAAPGVIGTAVWSFERYNADSDRPTSVSVSSGIHVRAGTWVHVAGVYDAATAMMTIYINGIARRSGTFDRANVFDANGPFTIGYGRWGGNAFGRVQGTVRDVRAYPQALTEQQVKYLLDDSGLGDDGLEDAG